MTQSDILDAIRAAVGPQQNDPGVAVQEFAEAEGLTIEAARGVLERGVRDGRLVKGRARRRIMDGRVCPVPVYRAVE